MRARGAGGRPAPIQGRPRHQRTPRQGATAQFFNWFDEPFPGESTHEFCQARRRSGIAVTSKLTRRPNISHRRRPRGGTEGSNPLCSSGESLAKLTPLPGATRTDPAKDLRRSARRIHGLAPLSFYPRRKSLSSGWRGFHRWVRDLSIGTIVTEPLRSGRASPSS